MVGRAGASQDAPVLVRPVVPTLSGAINSEIGTSGDGYKYRSLEAALGYPLNPTLPLLSAPFSADTDFNVFAAHFDRLTLALAESDDPALCMAFWERLAAALALLRPGLLDPIPPHLMDSLTVDTRPATFPCFAPDANTLCDYCQTLAQVLLCRTYPPEAEEQLNGLLSELVEYFAAEINAPRWVRTADGVKFIGEMMA